MNQSLAELTGKFERIGIPEEEKRDSNGAEISTISSNVCWIDEESSFAAPFETDDKFPSAYRLGKSWEAPPVVQWGELRVSMKDSLRHVFPYGQVATENMGLPPVLAAITQAMRSHEIDDTKPEDVQLFQNINANLSALFLPLVFGQMAKDNGIDTTSVDILCGFYQGVENGNVIDYGKAISDDPGIESKVSKVQTAIGSLSQARVVDYSFDVANIQVTGTLDFDIDFLAIHRAGMLPCILGKSIAEKFGINANIIGVDSTRENEGDHYTQVTGARLIPPEGYTHSAHSKLINNFVVPLNMGQSDKKRILVIFDPILATGSSSLSTVDAYLKANIAQYDDVCFAGFIGGGYGGVSALQKKGIKTFLVCHDQCDLTHNSYAQCGEGDAGDRLFMRNNEDTFAGLQSMAELFFYRPELTKHVIQYAEQICGKPSFP